MRRARKEKPKLGVNAICLTSRKKRHASRKVAITFANMQKATVDIYIYKCADCRDWHLTKSKGPGSEAVRRG